MKRYWLFCGECHYAAGGMYDFRESFDTQREAVEAGKTARIDPYSAYRFDLVEWWHVFDSATREVVSESEQKAYGQDEMPLFRA